MKKVLFSFVRSHFVVPCQAILEMAKKKLTQLLQLPHFQTIQLEIVCLERMFLKKMDCFGLGLDAGELVLFVVVVDIEPGGYGGGIGVDVVDEEGAAEGKDLDDD